MASLFEAYGLIDPQEQPPEKKPEPRGMTGVAKDVGISALKGAIAVPEAAVGLADLVTGGYAGKAAEAAGFRPAEARAMLEDQYSQEQKDAFARVQAADGFGDTLMEAIRNPSVIGHSVVESLPSMGAGGVLARGGMAVLPKLSPVLAGAFGEGATQAGQAAEAARQASSDGLLSARGAGSALLSGVLDTAIAAGSGGLAKRLGIADIDTMLAGAKNNPVVAKGLTRRVLEGMFTEGILEELPQSIQEQVLQNYGQGKPLDEGVNQAAVLGMLSGAAMGGGANVLAGAPKVPEVGPLSRAANQAQPAPIAAAAGMEAPAGADGFQNVAQPGGPTINAGGPQAAQQPPQVDPVVERIKKMPAGDREEALAAYSMLSRDDLPKGVRQYNSRLLDDLLAKMDEKPAAESSDPAALLSQGMERDPLQAALHERANEQAAQANLEQWMARAQPMPLQAAQEIQQAAAAQGRAWEIVPHAAGQGFTVVPAAWITPAMRGQTAAALPLDTAPTGVLRADARGNVAPETGAQAIDTRGAQAAAEAEARRKASLGLTPDVEAVQAGRTRAPLPEMQEGDLGVKSTGKPFGTPAAAQKAQAKNGGEVLRVKGGWVVRTQAAQAAQPVQAELEAGDGGTSGAGRLAAGTAGSGSGAAQRSEPAADAVGHDARRADAVPAGEGGAVSDAGGERAAALTTPEAPYYAVNPATKERVPVQSPEDGAAKFAKLHEATGGKIETIDLYDAKTGQPAFNLKPDGTFKPVETAEQARARSEKQAAEVLAERNAQKALPAPATPKAQTAPSGDRWQSADAPAREALLLSAGWKPGSPGLSTMKAQAWDKMTQGQRNRIAKAMEAAPAAEKPQLPSVPETPGNAVAAAKDPVRTLQRVMSTAGWQVEYVDLDLTGDKPKADIRLKRDDGRLVFAKLDAQGRATMETFQREKGLGIDPKNRQARVAPQINDVFLGRKKFTGGRSMLRGMVTYLSDNALHPVAIEDLRNAWAGVMSAPVTQQALAAPAEPAQNAPAEAPPTVAAASAKPDATGEAEAPDTTTATAPSEQSPSAEAGKADNPEPAREPAEAAEKTAAEGFREWAAKQPVPILESQISHEAAMRAHSGTSHSPDERGRGEIRDYVRTLAAVWRGIEAKYAAADEATQERVREQFEKLRDGYAQRTNAYLSAHANVMSSMIAGPARFPVASNRKKSDAADRRAQEAQDYLAKGRKAIARAFAGPGDASLTSELASIEKRIKEKEEIQETRKAANVALRKGDDAALKALGYAEGEIAALKKPDFAGRIGYPDYALQNNNAEIRRLKARLEDVQKRIAGAEAAAATQEEAPQDGGPRIVQDAEANRVRILFDGKPDEATRNALKAAGFRWSPTNAAWQRQLTTVAVKEAERIVASLKKTDAPQFRRTDGTASESPSTRAEKIQQFIDQITAKWANAPKVVVVQSMQDERVPQKVRDTDAAQRSEGADEVVHGFHYQGTVYLVADGISSAEEALTTLLHESVGHFGLRGAFGEGLKPILQQIVAMRGKDVRAKAADYGLVVDKAAVRAELGKGATDADVQRVINARLLYASEEVLAEMAQATPTLGFVKRAIAAIRTFLRDTLGLKLELTDDEIVRNYIIPAREFVVKGRAAGKTSAEPSFSRGAAAVGDNSAMDGWTKHEDQWGTYRMRGDAIDVSNNWKRFDSLPDDQMVILYHATGEGAAKAILKDGFDSGKAVWKDSKAGYVYMGGMSNGGSLGTYSARATKPGERSAFVAFAVRKGDIEPDAGTDWKSYLRRYGRDVDMLHGKDARKSPSAVVTFAEINQVRAPADKVIPIAVFDDGGELLAQSEDQQPMFSRTATGTNPATGKTTPGEAIKAVTVEDIRRRVGNTMAHYRSLALQALGRRQLVEIYGDDIPQLRAYSALVQKMDADHHEGAQEADDIATRWGKLKDERQLAELMHEATIAQIDPDKPHVQGDDRAAYDKLKRNFDALSAEAKTIWREARDSYEEHYSRVREAIRDRIERSELTNEAKARLLAKMDGDFFDKIKGVYFPLARFGDYIVVVKNAAGKAVNVSRAETINQAEAMREDLRKQYPAKDGFAVGKVLKQAEFNAAREAVSRGFMQDLSKLLEDKGLDAELQDSINQLYLSSLPDLSWAKHGIHRKNMPGFSQDARRAFAANMVHGTRYLARLRYADLMNNELQQAQKYVEAQEGNEQYDSIKARQVLDEMDKRHELLMNPKTNPVATALTSFGYIFHMGLAPATAFTNLTGTPLVAYPIMGAKWGFTKAGAALAKAARQAAANRNDLSRVLKGDEKEAFDEAVRRGTIDVTNAHDLSGIADGNDAKVGWKMRPVMKAASFMFHHAEKFNRQVTFMAAYRLARAKGDTHQQAFDAAEKVTYDTHFDYSSANRPRMMQGNWQRVLLLFKQYSQNMIYMFARNAHQAIRAMKPEERAEARRALAGLLVTHAAAAGVLGLPMVGMLLSAASFIGGSDDEPWDAEVALRNVLADTFGQKPAEVLARGLSRLTPWDISGRVGLDKLIFPDVQEGLEGQRFFEQAAVGALGPVAGIGLNVAKGMGEIGKGDWARGIEDMMPAALRGPMKAIRYGREGAIDSSGVPIKEEVGTAGIVGQALGFSPSEVRLATEGKSAILQADKGVEHRRKALMRQYAQAVIAGDQEHAKEVLEDVRHFNEKQPQRSISGANLVVSVRSRRRRIDEAEDGVYLPKSHGAARAAGRFATAETSAE